MPLPRKTKENFSQTAFTRITLVIACFAIWFLGVGIRLVHLQVSKHEDFKKMATRQRRDPVERVPLRGTIVDRDDRPLAVSLRVRSLAADPTKIPDIEGVADRLSPIIGVKKKDLVEVMTKGRDANRRFIYLARRLEDDAYEKATEVIKELYSSGENAPAAGSLVWRDEQRRTYPSRSLAAHIVGFNNADGKGQAGIEQSQNAKLSGTEVTGWANRDRFGRIFESTSEQQRAPQDVVLTISTSIQHKTEMALENGAKAAGAKSAMAVVMDPRTGEILAMANHPTFDLNSYAKAKPERWMNLAVQSVYAPGSVFKLVTYGSAVEENVIDPNGNIDLGAGVITVGGHTFKDSGRYGSVSFATAMAKSSNVGAIKTGQKLGRERYYEWVRKFGFGERTNVELPGELAGQLRAPQRWSGSSLGSLSIGYEIGVTALQMTSAFATIANDGVRVQPHIIKEYRGPDGSKIAPPRKADERVVSPETAAAIRKMLREVVLTGTGKQAQLNGYTSAGKTGTAWKYNPKTRRVDGSKYISSFIGYAPAENPSVVIAVIMDEGAGGGGRVSAPVFRDIAEQILPELNVIPDGTIRDDDWESDYVPEIPSEVSPESIGPLGDEPAPARERRTEANSTEDSPTNGKPKRRLIAVLGNRDQFEEEIATTRIGELV
jgi:cell division protein FtsI (penicillin-binding protein 3)